MNYTGLSLLFPYFKQSGNCANDACDRNIDLRDRGDFLSHYRAVQPKLVALVSGTSRPGHHHAVSTKTIHTSVNLYPTGYHRTAVVQKVPLPLSRCQPW